MAGVFARKQLNLVPALDLERDFMLAVNHLVPHWEFGIFQDIDEFFKAINPFLPPSIADSVGFVERRQLLTDNGDYVINEGLPTRNLMINVYLPETPVEGLNLQDMIFMSLSSSETLTYRMDRDEHPGYFDRHNIDWSIFERTIEAESRPKVLEYSDVVPVFVARRTALTGSSGTDFRNDRLEVPELITFPLDGGRSAEFTLVSFAVYHPGHYFALGKSFPSREWYVYNDESVLKPSVRDINKELSKNAVLLFYVKRSKHTHCHIPQPIENWSITSLITQHLRDRLVPRVKKMMKKAKKAEKRLRR